MFDIIIGNPPYQQSDGGYAASAVPVYHHFVQQAKRLNPQYLSLIIPARWYSGGKGLDQFRKEMLHDERIQTLHDFPNSKDCFPHVQIEGGICYFLMNSNHRGTCTISTHLNGTISQSKRMLFTPFAEVFIRYSEQLRIAEKVWNHTQTDSFAPLVSSLKPFGFRTDFFKNPKKYSLPPVSVKEIHGGFILYGLDENSHRTKRYIPADYPLPAKQKHIGKWKVFVPRALGSTMGGEIPAKIIGDSFVGAPNALCTETYLNIGDFESKREAEHCLSYIKTKFFRFLVGIIKTTQDAPRRVYQLVPAQNFSNRWTDEELYQKYGFTAKETAFIEKMIKAM